MYNTQGEKIRRQVMGDAFVDRSLQQADDFTKPMQTFIHEHGWGATWHRSGLTLKTRSLITIAMLSALKAPQELEGHIRGALRNGVSTDEIREVLLHSAVYCGIPSAQDAFRVAKNILKELKI
jgi:4-carboxymuconolactone decarboxylase